MIKPQGVQDALQFHTPDSIEEATNQLLGRGRNLLDIVAPITADQAQVIHACFNEFLLAISFFSDADHTNVIARFREAGLIDRLHGLRAHYESELEQRLALETLAEVAPGHALTRRLAKERYWAFTPDLCAALAGCRKIAFAGSGALPLTPLLIATELGIPVTCMDSDPIALTLGKQIADLSLARHLITHKLADMRTVRDLDEFDAIVGAVLVGIDPNHSTSGLGSHKRNIIKHLQDAAPSCQLIFRLSHGLAVLIFPTVEPDWFGARNVRRITRPRSIGAPYISGLLIADRLTDNITGP
jgi:Nicotianamine synthase protein